MADDLSFAIVTPSFNQVAFIERTIRSVLDQNVSSLEYLVVDGGSTDGSVEILKQYADRLRFRSEPDDGQGDAVNKGIRLTSGALIGWLNSDDVYYPGSLEAVRNYFAAHPEVDVVYGNADHIDQQDRVIEPYYCEPWDANRLREVCFLCQPAVFFRRRVVEQYGPLDARLRFCMDYDYWIRLALRGARFGYMQRRLAGSRMYPWNKTLGNWSTSHAEINRVLRRALGSVPTRWLSNYAHVVLIERGIGREQQLKFTASLVLLTWWASLRWNHRLSADVRHLTAVWLRDAYQNWRSRRAAPAAAPDAALPAVRSGHERRLRIALDVSQTGTLRAGCGQMALGLAQALEEFEQHDYLLYPTLGDAYWDPSGPDATWRSNRAHMRRWTAHPSLQAAREFWRKPPPNLDEALGSPDVLHSHNFFCPRGLAQARVVYTLHDLGFLQDPDWTTEANRQACFEGVFNASLYADFMIAMSEATRRHFQTMFPHYPEERTAVVYSASRFTGRGPVRRPRGYWKLRAGGFLLTVGTLEPRKNLTRLLTAYASYAARASTPLPLVLAGSDGWLMERLDEQIAALGLQRRVIRLGYVDDRALLWLYQNCCAFLYPSLFEGFGLPVVEALSQGAAVMTSNTTSLPEVAGDAALFVDPIDVAAMTAAVERLVVDAALRDDLKRRAVVQAARFSWQATAEQTLRCYQRAMRLPKYVAAMSSRAS